MDNNNSYKGQQRSNVFGYATVTLYGTHDRSPWRRTTSAAKDITGSTW